MIDYNTNMEVIKRDGRKESIKFDKITTRIQNLCTKEDLEQIDPTYVAQQTIQKLKNGITTEEIDEFSSQICVSLAGDNPRYSHIAGKICISNLQKKTSYSFYETIKKLYFNRDFNDNHVPLVSHELYKKVDRHRRILDKAIDHDRDYYFNYFGFKTLERSYLMRINNEIVERPQYMWMRVALAIHMDNIEQAIETYNLMSQGYFTHATPTLFNAGTLRQQCSSCYLIGTQDSINGIYDTLKKCSMISKYAGGIGLHISNIRCRESIIRGTNGKSNGIVPMLKVFNETARYVDQCFTPNTIIYTNNGYKKLQDIVPGDKVITLDGSFQKVTHIMQDNLSCKLLCFNNIQVTENHPLYIKKKINDKPEFLEAKYIQSGYYIGSPIPKYINDIESYDLDDCKLYGILLGYGKIINNKCYIVNSHHNEFVKSYLDKYYIIYTINWDIIEFDFDYRFKFSYNMLYNKSIETKRIHPNFIHLPKEKILMILEGMDNIINCITKKSSDEIQYWFDNYGHNLRYLLLRCGITLKNQLILNNILWSQIEEINYQDYRGIVIDLRIENNHNYLTEYGLAHNGGGRRKGSIAIYLEPHHGDILDFLEMKLNTGAEEMRARDLFYALYINDLFMERVEKNELWSLMCPDICPKLNEVYGEEYRKLYETYEKEGKYIKQIPARDIIKKVYLSLRESGTPYIVNKDACNIKSNQKNLGTIKSSNLCSEIIQYSSDEEVAVCNLASIALVKFVNDDLTFDFEKLRQVANIVTKNLNKIIDINFYPIIETKKSNMKHRPIGIGVQGLADTYIKMRIPFDSYRAQQLNKKIFETIYFGACQASNEIATERALFFQEYFKKHNKLPRGFTKLKEEYDIMKWDKYYVTKAELDMIISDNIDNNLKGTYITYQGSPFSEGKFQFDLWNKSNELSGMWDWKSLRKNVLQYGMRNSLLTALMPTASTSQILGNNEAFEPFTSNIYKRRTIAGEFIIVNKYLVEDLIKLGIWNRNVKEAIIRDNGSIQNIDNIPLNIKKLYKTVWEIKQIHIVNQAADRAIYIDQSQSMNIWMTQPNINQVVSMLFTGWKKGLKTLLYYLRTKPASNAKQYGINKKNDNEECTMCSA